MTSNTYIGYSNVLRSRPLISSGVTNPDLMASAIVGRKSLLATSAYFDFQFQATTGLRMVGADGLVLGSGTPSIAWAFSNVAPGASELGTVTKTPSLTSGYSTQAWIMDAALAEARFARVTFTNCAAVGLCWASVVLNPAIGIQVGMPRTPIDYSKVTRSALTGAATTRRGPMSRSVGVKFLIKTNAEWAAFDDMVVATGIHSQVLLIPGLSDELRNRDLILGQLVNLQASTHVSQRLREWPFEIQKSL